jgi:hypothetical protein
VFYLPNFVSQNALKYIIWKIQAQKENALTQEQQLLALPLKWVVQEVVQETPIGGLINFD